MAHVGHEIALHVLQLLPFRNVLDEDDDADILAVFVLKPVVVDREDAAAVGEDVLGAVDLAVALDARQADVVGDVTHQRVVIFGQRIRRIQAQDGPGCRIDVDDAALQVDGHQAVRHVLQDGGELVLLSRDLGQRVGKLLPHQVEHLSQLPDLVVAVYLNAFRKIAGRHL